MVKPHARFSIRWFILQIISQVAVLLLGLHQFFPRLWAQQISTGLLAILATFLLLHLFMCFFEWAFHRYVLHATLLPFLAYFSRSHRNHHELTSIKLDPKIIEGLGKDRYVLNHYPIIEEEQYEDAAFPPYALAAFWLFFTPVLVLFQQLLPGAPIMLGGYLAIAWSMALYEIFHAIEHYPYEWWEQAINHPRFGNIWKNIYGFHHFHHANISANEAISGFFGFPIADWVFMTYHQPKELLLQGRVASAKDFKIPPPWPFVVWLDAWARKQEAKIRHHNTTS